MISGTDNNFISSIDCNAGNAQTWHLAGFYLPVGDRSESQATLPVGSALHKMQVKAKEY